MNSWEEDDGEAANVVLDFIFASQDALTSGLTFALHLMSVHPDVLQRVRDEHKTVLGDRPLDLDGVASLTYTNQVVKEVLRYRPPVTMVIHEAKKDIQLTRDVTVPKGALVVPPIWTATRTGFKDPEVH
jgi:C-22 sterol desaturase